MKKQLQFYLLLLLICLQFNCTKQTGQDNGNNNNGGGGGNTPKAQVTIQLNQPMNIYLPNNCSRSFIIKNTGDPGSVLNYTVLDNGALGGYLDFTNAIGSLSANNSATINVTVDPQFVSSQLLPGSTLKLDIATPGATNGTHAYVSVYPKLIEEQAQEILGVWSGTWGGNSYGAANPGQPSPNSPASGNWQLNIQAVNLFTGAVSGTFTWSGTDSYWNYTFDSFGNITSATPVAFLPNQSVPFNASNSWIQYPAIGSACDRFHLVINDMPGSSYGIYGPKLIIDIDIKPNTVHMVSGSWVAWPFAPFNNGAFSVNQSNGQLTGHR